MECAKQAACHAGRGNNTLGVHVDSAQKLIESEFIKGLQIYWGYKKMSYIVPVLVARRKRLMSEFEKNGAICEEKAVTVQEIYDNWQIKVIKLLRMRAITLDTKFLCRKGKLIITEDGKYYLNIV